MVRRVGNTATKENAMQLERAQSAKQPQSMPPATRGELEKAVEIAREIRTRERFNKLDFYDPYPYQQNFHETGSEANQRLLMAANRIGKSYCGAAETGLSTVRASIHSGGMAGDLHNPS